MARSIKSDLEILIGFENGYSKETKPKQNKKQYLANNENSGTF